MGTIPVVVFLVLAMIGLPIALVMVAAGLSGAISIGGIGFIEIIFTFPESSSTTSDIPIGKIVDVIYQ